MNTVDFVYSPLHRVRFITVDNDGYKYKDTGEEVKPGEIVHSGQRISFADFLNWAGKPEHYLLDSADERVVKIYGEANCAMHVCCADGFFDEQYLPWDEFEKYNTVIVVGNRFIMINDDGEEIELTALTPSVPMV